MSTVLNGTPSETQWSHRGDLSKPQFPGMPATSDGAEAVVWVETHITQGASAYPITSSIPTCQPEHGAGDNMAARRERLEKWRLLQELAGVK